MAHASWFGSSKGEEKENFKQNLLNSKIVLDKLLEIVYNMDKEREEVSFNDYDSPSWSHKQAHTNGYREALRRVIEVIDIGKERPNSK